MSMSPVRKLRNQINRLAVWRKRIGLPSTFQWVLLRLAVSLGFPEPEVWLCRPRQVSYPIVARLQGSSDMHVFDQIFLFEEYSCLKELREPSLVLDLGANVGFSAAYFLNAFPKAHIVAVEPDEANFIACCANLAPYGNRAIVVHGAAWSERAKLRLMQGIAGDGREWSFQVGEAINGDLTSADVEAWDVGSLIDMSGIKIVDLLKVDIERAELSVFGESAGVWISRVRNICIELHGKDCEEAFFGALQDFDYELQHAGELTICRNLRPRQMPQLRSSGPRQNVRASGYCKQIV